MAAAHDGQTGPDAAAPPRTWPIGIYLFVLALVALVPAILFSALLLERNNAAQQAVVQSLTQATTQALANTVDRQIDGMVTTLRVLGTAQSLGEANFASFHGRASTALAASGAFLIALDANFQQLLNTRVPFGTTLGKTSDPDSAALALSSGEVVISNVFFGATAQAYVFNIVLPLSLPANNPARLLVITQNATALSGALSSRELPAGWNVALLDGTGALIAASPGAGGMEPGKPAAIALPADTSMTGGWREASVGQTPVVAISWKVPNTGWQVVAWAPRNMVERPFADAVWLLLFGGLILAGLVAGIVWWITNRIAGAVQGLAADAKRLGAGETFPERRYPIAEIATVSAAIGTAARQRHAAETEVKFLMRELAHRSKNQMTVIAAMAKQTAKSANSVGEFVDDFEHRIFGLARSTDLLLANGVSGVDLRELLTRQIEPFCPLDSGRVTLSGPPVRLNNQAAQILGMAAHELATNAVKYGAFSREDGTLTVTWVRENERLVITWREHIRALAKHAERRGFGTVVIENMVGSALAATVNRAIRLDGIEWSFDLPFANLDPALMPPPVMPPAGSAPPERPAA